MKAAVFNRKHDMQVSDVDLPALGAEDVLIKVMSCGICGTDVHIYEGAQGAAETIPPAILGHEFSGFVEKLGANVKGFTVGERVSIDPNNYCGACSYCKNGMAHYCENMIGYGTTAKGGFAQYCSVSYKQVYPIGDMPFEHGAMAEPVACCLHGIDMCDIKSGTTVLIIGGGTIGLIMLQLAKLSGASTVILSEPESEKREKAALLGADILIDPINENIENVLNLNGISDINTVIECVGLKRTMLDAIKYAGKKSTVMLFGLGSPDDEIPVKPFELFKKEITLKASYINPYTQGRALELIKSGKVDTEALKDKTIGLGELSDTLADPKKRSKGKVFVDPWL